MQKFTEEPQGIFPFPIIADSYKQQYAIQMKPHAYVNHLRSARATYTSSVS
jgi:hypothetical protein